MVLESPFAGDTTTNLAYARAAMHDSLMRGEAPFASHMLYTQPGVLDDSNEYERGVGIEANLEWMAGAQGVALYIDRGITPGMSLGIKGRHSGRTRRRRTQPSRLVRPRSHRRP
ncbi:hypothetical protein [Brevibacterium aurantiacum]|uniref:DUF7768 domain-containing protein n=1 Tax=Brevibacterium aurantiacum TaxID=273384 RepID=UPI0016424DF0|nr:hypothetical protein [Brevibacterium aurantiacum]